jgi:hypothetical protein
MTFIVRGLFCFMFFLLSGCGAVNHYQAQLTCKATCQERFIACNKTCDNSCSGCCQASNQRTAREYDHYLKQQAIQGKAVVRELNSYRDPLQCRKTTCECPTDYRTCIQTCSGKVPKKLQMAPAC